MAQVSSPVYLENKTHFWEMIWHEYQIVVIEGQIGQAHTHTFSRKAEAARQAEHWWCTSKSARLPSPNRPKTALCTAAGMGAAPARNARLYHTQILQCTSRSSTPPQQGSLEMVIEGRNWVAWHEALRQADAQQANTLPYTQCRILSLRTIKNPTSTTQTTMEKQRIWLTTSGLYEATLHYAKDKEITLSKFHHPDWLAWLRKSLNGCLGIAAENL